MNIRLTLARWAIWLLLLALVPGSRGFAQAQRARHGGAPAQKKAQATARATPKAMTPHPAATEALTSKGDARPTGTRTPNRSDEELVAALHSTRQHLNQAGQVGSGHHARALREIDTAIKHLSPRTALATAAKVNQAQPPGVKPLANPALHRAEAQKLLRSVESGMSANGINAHQFILARASVQNAIRELNLAQVEH